jgi:predicted  nucleic acid-binding Zn-ribbon protein
MLPDLERLIALQRLDSAASDAQRRLGEAPDREQAFEARLDVVRERLAAAKALLADNQTVRRAAEKDVGMQQGRLSKFRDQLMAVKTNREYQAMQHEIETAQNEVRTLEEQLLVRMVEADDLTAAVKAIEAELAAEQKAIDADRRTMAAETGELGAAVDRIAAERAAVVASIEPRVLALYEQIARKRNGIGLSEARGGVCTICHVRLRPQVFNTVLRNDDILQCDHCNRILYYVPAPAAAAAPSDPLGQPAS